MLSPRSELGHRPRTNYPCRAYNDILYLCEKYGPLEELEKYDPDGDVVLTGGYVPFVIEQMA